MSRVIHNHNVFDWHCNYCYTFLVMRAFSTIWLFMICYLALPLPLCLASMMSGIVFEDLNCNGLREAGEPGLKGIKVSDGAVFTRTNSRGGWSLPGDGGDSFVFIIKPGGYRLTTPWYRAKYRQSLPAPRWFIYPAAAKRNKIASPWPFVSFGLTPAPRENKSSLFLVQVSDVHISEDYSDTIDGIVREINDLQPELVVDTGDLIYYGDRVTPTVGRRWFDLYLTTMKNISAPRYSCLGNHDLAGLSCRGAETGSVDFGKGLFKQFFGPTWYSLNVGNYHLVMLDPNMVEGRRLSYGLSPVQLMWLKQDLELHRDRLILIFYHEPTSTWTDREAFLSTIKPYQVLGLFSGHVHKDHQIPLDGITEQVTGAVSGSVWTGPNSDGQPAGYRLICAEGDRVYSFFKGAGLKGHIRLMDPVTPVIHGPANFRFNIWAATPVRTVYAALDGVNITEITLSKEGQWLTGTAAFDSSAFKAAGTAATTMKALPCVDKPHPGNDHLISVVVTTRDGIFTETFPIRSGGPDRITIRDLKQNPGRYYGKKITARGTITASFKRVFVLKDETGAIPVYYGDCYHPPKIHVGSKIRGTFMPVEFCRLDELELLQTQDLTVIGQGAVPPAEKKTVAEIGQSTVGHLIKLAGVTVIRKDRLGFFARDATGEIYCFMGRMKQGLKEGLDAIRKDDVITVTGVGWRYKERYELSVRSADDLMILRRVLEGRREHH